MLSNKRVTFCQPKVATFFCQNCEYITNNKHDFIKHGFTRKHKTSNNVAISATKSCKKLQKISQDHECIGDDIIANDTILDNANNSSCCDPVAQTFTSQYEISQEHISHDILTHTDNLPNDCTNSCEPVAQVALSSCEISQEHISHDISIVDDENNCDNKTNVRIYSCNICQYITKNNYNYEKHKLSKKHKLNETVNALTLNKNICDCGKIYKDRSGLWRHSKKCKIDNEKDESTCNPTCKPTLNNELNNELTHAIINLLKQNQEFKELMIEQAKQTQEFQTKQAQEFQSQLIEFAKEGRNTIINNTSFNLNVYLNETWKDAVNMVDFVNSLHLDLSDLEETGKLGYSGGMSRIFINGLKDMEVHKRPIHCSDLKREILYIKEDNVWEKDNENRDGIKNALRKIEQKNIQQIPLWIKAHPNCVISSNRENTPYLKMVMQSTGGPNPDETANMAKIISNIAKETVISK
jgi:hypothetical protein